MIFSYFFLLYFKYFLRHLSLYLLLVEITYCKSIELCFYAMSIFFLFFFFFFFYFYILHGVAFVIIVFVDIHFVLLFLFSFYLKSMCIDEHVFKNRLISVRVLLQLSSAVIEKKLYNTYVYMYMCKYTHTIIVNV